MDYKKDMEESGRGTDTVMGHLSLGEVVIPRAFLDDPQVMQALKNVFDSTGTNMAEFTVGDKANKINPETGQPEFFLKGLKSIFKSPVAQIAVPIAASFLAPGIGTALSGGLGLGLGAAGSTALGAGALGTGLGLASGKNIGQALKSGALSGGLSYGGSMLASGVGDTALGRAFSDVKAGVADTALGRGLSDIGRSASGVFDSVGSGINDLYQGSSVQNAFRSGSDALKSGFGIDVGGSAATAPTAIGGGASSYSGAVDPTGKYSFGSALDKVGGASTAALNESSPLLSALSPYAPTAATAAPSLSASTALTGASSGAKPVANSFLAPVLSAALGYNTNQEAADALLEQQRANMALLSPYAKDFTFTPGDLTTDQAISLTWLKVHRHKTERTLPAVTFTLVRL